MSLNKNHTLCDGERRPRRSLTLGSHAQRAALTCRFYTSGVIQLMLEAGRPFMALEVDAERDFYVLGTPEQVEEFARMWPTRAAKRWCFDLDNTLVTHPSVAGDYTSCRPIPHMIQVRCRGTDVVNSAPGARHPNPKVWALDVTRITEVRVCLCTLDHGYARCIRWLRPSIHSISSEGEVRALGEASV